MSVLHFALRDRWIVTVESDRVLVNVRHRTRWYVMERRHGHEDRSHWCATRRDALSIANMLRYGHEKLAKVENDLSYPQWLAFYTQNRDALIVDLQNQLGADMDFL